MPYYVSRTAVMAIFAITSLHLSQACSQDIYSNTSLMEAALRGDLKEVSRMVEIQHVNVNETNGYGLNVLYFAAGATPTQPVEKGVAGSSEVLQYLLEHGADVRAKSNRSGINALMVSADNGRPDRVKLLLSHGADPNAADIYGNTPLMYAIRRKDAESVRLLLEAGANINIAGINGDSPILAGVQMGNPAIVQMLLTRGPNMNSANRNGEVPLANAVMNGNEKIALMLLDADANPNVHSRNLGGMTPLMLAAQYGNAELVSHLLKKHAEVGLKDDAGRTASYYALHSGHWGIYLKLLAAVRGVGGS